MLRIFTPLKIQRLRPGLNPQTWMPEASMLTTRPPKPLLQSAKEERNILPTVNQWKDNRIGKILCRNCLIKHVIEGKMGRRGEGRKQLMDDFNEARRYWNWRDGELVRTLWRTLFGRVYGPVVRLRDDGDGDGCDDDDDGDDDKVRYNFDNFQMIFILSFIVAISTVYWHRL